MQRETRPPAGLDWAINVMYIIILILRAYTYMYHSNNSVIGSSRQAGRADGIEPVGPPVGHVQPCMTEIMPAGPMRRRTSCP